MIVVGLLRTTSCFGLMCTTPQSLHHQCERCKCLIMQVCTTCLVLSPSHQPGAKYQFSISWKAALARLAVKTNKEEGSLPLMIIPDLSVKEELYMWLGGCPNLSKMEQCWECTFLNLYSHVKTKLASKKFSTFGLQR